MPISPTYRYGLQVMGGCLLLGILCFPFPDLAYDTGLDSPLGWVFNHLFSTELSAGRHFLFPHGPLAFFTYPSYETFWFTELISFVLLCVLFHSLYRLNILRKNKFAWLLSIAGGFMAYQLMDFNALLIINLLLAGVHHRESRKEGYMVLGLLLTGFAFYVKAYLAVVSMSLMLSYIFLDVWEHRNWKRSLLYLFGLLLSVLFFWILLYQGFSGVMTYCYGLSQLVADNSSAVAYYPENDWWLLSLFLLSMAVFLFADKSMRWWGCLVLLSIYAAWKHGMSREDSFHISGLCRYLVVLVIIGWIYAGKPSWYSFLAGVMALLFFGMNAERVPLYTPVTLNLSGPSNAWNMLVHGKAILAEARSRTESNFKKNRLSEATRNRVGQATVDVYPWDLSLLPANSFHWQGRPVIQSYASYTSWLDRQNAQHIASPRRPLYLFWEINKGTQVNPTENMESIDERYLLNDEPNTLLEILRWYAPVGRDGNFAIYTVREHPLALKKEEGTTQHTYWNQWTRVAPYSGKGIDRVRLKLQPGMLQRLKSWLYKDEAVYLLYHFSDGEILKHKLVPKNAEDGIWIHPYIRRMGGSTPVAMVDAIQLQCSNVNLPIGTIGLSWEHWDAEKSDLDLARFFLLEASAPETEVFFNSLEATRPHWESTVPLQRGDDALSGKGYYRVDSSAFSCNFSVPLKAYCKKGGVLISGQCWLKGTKTAEGSLVISVKKGEESLLWKGANVKEQLLSPGTWCLVNNSIRLPLRPEDSSAVLNLHVWNTGKTPLLLDDIYVKLVADSL